MTVLHSVKNDDVRTISGNIQELNVERQYKQSASSAGIQSTAISSIVNDQFKRVLC